MDNSKGRIRVGQYWVDYCNGFFLGLENKKAWCQGFCCGNSTFRYCCNEYNSSLPIVEDRECIRITGLTM
ncbi:hypothetical protein Ciccas_012444 [Cichlidogyrus casuarinus]|uniref:Shisa N-terminal domain-containing protein n=1 Tax=Cichlidogyrus casuarinus TaxID=1844966 RepID=A0ABD2PPK4_9PLAT